ncbi:MAG: glycoside hydrolase family 3 C-terminal domain-containing protein, partial [Prolixibacteraceae bacterium]|nr:glycoside hydrolase family 3 C-terminal domain-containing protein [Prolixibacteraceae bacterium]
LNIFRDPRWGRGMETYGEDPFLTGKMGISFINGLQGDDPNYFKLIATAKHFIVHSGPESSRHSFDTKVSDYDFYNTYLPHFKATIEQANVQSVMCAYNRYDGEPCCGSGFILNDLLREKLGFKGYVVSDCWALVDFYDGHNVSKGPVEASALALKSGTDLNCGAVYPNLLEAMEKGLVVEEDVNIAVKRLFKARFQLGMFDPDELNPYAQIKMDVVNSEKHQKGALEMARKSMVLLKNENNTLPLSKNLKSIAVIGPNSFDEEVLLGNYNGLPLNAITPLAGIQQKVGNKTVVNYARGCDVAPNLPFLSPIPSKFLFTNEELLEQGLKAEFFDTTTFDRDPVYTRIDKNIDFNWWDKAPVSQVPDDNFGIRWTGYLVPDKTGNYEIGADGSQYFDISINGEKLVEHEVPHEYRKSYEKIKLIAGKKYAIEVNYVNRERTALMHLLWAQPSGNLEEEAISLAKKSDAIVMFMGLSPRLEGEEMKVEVEGFEGGDRLTLGLPETQIHLMKELKKLNKPLVLVLLNGSAVSIPWEKENIPAILEAWYPGQAAGSAIADILFGDYNPSGRLPLTFYNSVQDLPPFDDYSMQGRTYRYFKGEPLFEFGYGLSYTNFNYSNLNLSSNSIDKKQASTISIEVANTGNFNGEEVVQLYVKYPSSSIPRPIKELKGFKRIALNVGESKKVEFEINSELLSHLTPEGSITEPGIYTLLLGSSSNDLNLNGIKIEVEE